MRVVRRLTWIIVPPVIMLYAQTELWAQLGGVSYWGQSECVYPDDVFLHAGKGGRVLDVTKAPFGAKGDGKTDDTAAFIRAYDYVLAEMDKVEWDASGPESLECSYIIYIPDGTYLLSDTITYSGPIRAEQKASGPNKGQWYFERVVRIRIVGQSRNGTVLRLKDHSPGFEAGAERPVLSYSRADFNNRVAYNVLRNLTINTGNGNPGAVGVDFAGANMTGIRNVRFRSEDGQGSKGLHIRIPPTMGYHSVLTIEGFDYGICMTPYHVTHNSFEHVQLRGQRKAGIRLVDSTTSIRGLVSENTVPALEIVGPGAQAVLIDSALVDGAGDTAAIDLQAGQLFARDVDTSGYGMAVGKNGKPLVAASEVDEYVSGGVFVLDENVPKESLNLSIEEVPGPPWQRDLGQWANVDAYGAIGDGTTDDSDAVQQAMNSGKSTVYFPKAAYKIGRPIDVPATVRCVNFLFGVPRARFRVVENGPPIVFQDGVYVTVEQAAERTVVIDHVGFLSYRNVGAAPMGKLFLNNCTGYGKNPASARQLRIWARFINTESPGPVNFFCNGSDMWVFGYKVEKGNVNFQAMRGGRLEILGGVANEHGFDAYPAGENPIVLCENSKVSYVGCTNGPGRFENIVEEKSGNSTQRLRWDALPERVRTGGPNDVFVPLYVGDTFTPR